MSTLTAQIFAAKLKIYSLANLIQLPKYETCNQTHAENENWRTDLFIFILKAASNQTLAAIFKNMAILFIVGMRTIIWTLYLIKKTY